MKQSDDLGIFSALIAASAASGNVATVPDTQATAGDGSASIALGFPPETFIDRAAGGSPPRGADMNGFLNRLSRAIQVLQAGYVGPFNAAFAQAIGGYPAGAIVSGSTPGSFWVSTADSNVTTPGASGATWKSLFDGYLTAVIAASTYVKKAGDTSTGDQLVSNTTPSATTGAFNASPHFGCVIAGRNCEFDMYVQENVGTATSGALRLTFPGTSGASQIIWLFNQNGRVTFGSNTFAFLSDIPPAPDLSPYATKIALNEAEENLQTQISAKQPAGNYVTGPQANVVIDTVVATVTGTQDISLGKTYSNVLFVTPQNGTDGKGTGMTNVNSWTNSTANVSVASYHTGAPQGATISQTFLVIAIP